MTSCSGSEGPGRTSPREDGPLGSSLNGGGNSLAVPDHATAWDGTFGSLILCTRDGSTVRVKDVRYDFKAKPESVTPAMRFVPAADRRDGAKIKYAPVLARVGDVPSLALGAESIGSPDGAEISEQCDALKPDSAYHELLTTLHVTGPGGWVDGIDIDYVDSDDQDYTLHVDWNYIACGSQVDSKDASC